jgi:hypothetical protein
MKQIVYYIVVLFAFTSCFEDDVKVEPHEPGDLTTATVEMAETYKYQVYFDLETSTSISQNIISEWDLGFETADSGWHIFLNTSKMMLAGNSMNTDFNTVTSSSGLAMNFDPSTGNRDTTAIGNWYDLTEDLPVSKGYVYVIDRGTDENSNSVGLKKVVFDIQENKDYQIRFADLDGSDEQTVIIPKDTSVNFVCFSFDNGIVDIEPNKKDWDLQFTKYSTLLFTDAGEPYPYLVAGVLLNPYKVAACADTLHTFPEITLEEAEELSLTTRKDVIGYDWKDYGFTSERYTVDVNKVYVIRDVAGYYYQLRFIGFYNSTGEKGFPTFEYVRL